jgi:hypothetical protein
MIIGNDTIWAHVRFAVAGTPSASARLRLAQCGSAKRRCFQVQQAGPAYRCRTCDGSYALLTGTVFEGSR